MCLGEILWRIRRMLWQIVAKYRHKAWQAKYEKNSLKPSSVLDRIDKVNFYGLADMEIENIPEDWVEKTTSIADKLLQHRYEYLAIGEIDLGEEISWNHEYQKDIDTPLEFGPWMNYRDTDSYGDFKYFWELPRLQHLIILAKAYYLTGNEDYAKETAEQIKGFVEQSPYLQGVNWIMPMEPAIRLVSITWITAFLKEYLAKHPDTCQLIEQIVTSHVDYITKNYAAYSSANNHLIGEAAGVFVASICFSQIKGMKKHQEEAYNILCKEIISQHHADGVNKEQAIHYQLFALDFFVLAGLLGRDNNVEFPDSYWQMLENSVGFVAAITDSSYSIPEIGDSDDGKAVLLSDLGDNMIQSLIATSAILFERAEFKAIAKTLDEKSFWLLGNKGRVEFDTLKSVPSPINKKFEDGGYYILSSNKSVNAKVVVDCGPLGLGSIAAHGHADSLSFVLNAYGRSFFVDPGTYTYVADDPYRNYFRSTYAHNTIVVDGLDQSQIAGAFLWSQKTNSFVKDFSKNDSYDEIIGWHDGYQRLQSPVTHRRSIKLDKEKEMVTIDDYLDTDGTHKIDQCFHLNPECHVERISDDTWRITHTGKVIELVIDAKLSCKIYEGNQEPILGWCSNTYGQKCQTNTFVCQGTLNGSQQFKTKIRLAV